MNKAAILITLALAALSACKQEAAQTPAAALDAKPGIAVSEARMAMPAVKGNPAAAYFTLTNSGQAATTIAAIAVAGVGKTDMHTMAGGKMQAVTGVPVAPGATIRFAPGGLHVMAFDLEPRLAAGQTSELTVTFADGDKISAPLEIVAPGGQAASHGADH